MTETYNILIEIYNKFTAPFVDLSFVVEYNGCRKCESEA